MISDVGPNLTRTIYCEDAIQWLSSRQRLAGCSFVTSLPDLSEFGSMPVDSWKKWFIDAAALVMDRCPDEGVAIFYQTDLKKDGQWIDKSYLCMRAAEQAGMPMLWHKVVCKAPAGVATFGRPAYSHLLCFSRGVRDDISQSTADVLPQAGEVTWTRGMGALACLAACRYILKQTSTRTVVDPFCGHGTVLAAANALGLQAIGVEKGAKRAKRAGSLRLSLEGNLLEEVIHA